MEQDIYVGSWSVILRPQLRAWTASGVHCASHHRILRGFRTGIRPLDWLTYGHMLSIQEPKTLA